MKTNYELAQDCLRKADDCLRRDASEGAMYWLARAQVYATLAQLDR